MLGVSTLLSNLAGALDPIVDAQLSTGFYPYEWQKLCLQPGLTRVQLLCARQSGKTTIVSVKSKNKLKYTADALVLIISPTERQSIEMMKKVESALKADPGMPAMKIDNRLEKEFVNGSRIIALPGIEKSIRGYSDPDILIFDEASRIMDEVFEAAMPMLIGSLTSEVYAMTTPHGKRGWFYEEWIAGEWTRIMVQAPNLLVDDREQYHHQMREYCEHQGVNYHISERHLIENLKKETRREYYYRQEYLCEFMELQNAVFTREELEGAAATIRALQPDLDTIDLGALAVSGKSLVQ